MNNKPLRCEGNGNTDPAIKDSPLISVVMPAYNTGAFIGEAIDSILNQSEQNFELIIRNDGSSDDTEAVVKSYSSDKIRYYANPENLGISKTRNKLIEAARGKYLAIADSDDIYHPCRLAMQAEFLESRPEVGVVSARIRSFEGQPPAFSDIQAKKVKIRLKPKQIRSRLFFKTASPMPHPTTMIRKEVLSEHGIFYDSRWLVAGDYHLFQQFGLVTDMVELDVELCLYRIHSSNISKNRALSRKNTLQSRIEFLKNDFNADIDGVFDDEGRIKDAEKFTRLNAEIEKVVKSQIHNPLYDAEMLQNGAINFLYKALRDLGHRTKDYGAIYAAYRQSELLRRIRISRKLRLYLKALLFPRS